ncbi:MAG: VTT domain-containing protein [Candidatus Dormibacteraeota bacterium]|nr:VTT domain-containing protein [Candidatus Dormibacteraeota bacterium]
MTVPAITALASIAALLFIEEVGVPLPMFPADGLLLSSGILAATGSLPAAVVLPLLFITDVAGATIGYSWVRAVGREPLRRLAGWLGAGRAVDRLSGKMRTAGAAGVFATRLVPGTRVYTNLVAGAVGMRPRTFLAGMLPASAVWVVGISSLGLAIGNRADRYLQGVQQLDRDVVLGLALVSAAYLAVRVVLRHRRQNDVPAAPIE